MEFWVKISKRASRWYDVRMWLIISVLGGRRVDGNDQVHNVRGWWERGGRDERPEGFGPYISEEVGVGVEWEGVEGGGGANFNLCHLHGDEDEVTCNAGEGFLFYRVCELGNALFKSEVREVEAHAQWRTVTG